MNAIEAHLVQIVTRYLPQGAVIVTIDRPAPHPAVISVDLNGDRAPEIAVVYKYDDSLYLLVLRGTPSGWEAVLNEKGPGFGVTLLTSAPITGAGHNNLLVGWQLGAVWSQLGVYEWRPNELVNVVQEPLTYSYIEVLDLHGPSGPDGKAELAIWVHDTGEAYRVEVLRYDNGQFVPAHDLYRLYFLKVVAYYESMVRQHPDYTFYWYYLADAQFKAGLYPQALQTVRKAQQFTSPYPSKEELQQLEKAILKAWKGEDLTRLSGLFPAAVRTASATQWGYIDRNGNMSIQPRFTMANSFQDNGLAVVQTEGGAGLINTAGKFVVQPIYDSITGFSEGRSSVIDKEGFKVIDEAGHVLTTKAYSYIGTYHDGRAMFNSTEPDGNSKYGYLDLSGNEAIPATFMSASDFSHNKAVVQVKENEYALIRPNGSRIATYAYPYVSSLGDGLLAFQQEAGGKYGYINEAGKVVIPPAYSMAGPFEGGRAVVNTSDDFKSNYGLIDKKGIFIVKPTYNEIRQLGEQRLALGRAIDEQEPFKGSRFAIADNKGERLSDFLYYDVSDFKNGLAAVYDKTQTYFIDRSGNAASGYPRVDGSGTLTIEDGLIAANVDQRLSYLKRDGQVVWKPNAVIPLHEPYRVREVKYKPNKDYLVYYPQVEGMKRAAEQQKLNARLKTLSQVKPVPSEKQLDASYSGDFEVSFFKKDLLQLQLTGYNYPFGAAHGMPTMIYVPINLTTGDIYTLSDLFKPGSDYVKVLSDIVGQQIKEDPKYDYVFPDTYKGIAADQPFFVSANALHLYFAPYEIGPYAAGFPTFNIPFSQLQSILNTEGAFWRSFH
nr:WG repeat-containing protein [Paenibacillus phyllosphaerae]